MKIKPAHFHHIGSAPNWSELLKKQDSGKGRKMSEVLCWMHDPSEFQVVVKALLIYFFYYKVVLLSLHLYLNFLGIPLIARPLHRALLNTGTEWNGTEYTGISRNKPERGRMTPE